MAGWDPEPVLDAQGGLPAEVVCHGLALGLAPAKAASGRPRLCVRPSFAAAGTATAAVDRAWFTGVERIASTQKAQETPGHAVAPLSTSVCLVDCAWIEVPTELDKDAA